VPEHRDPIVQPGQILPILVLQLLALNPQRIDVMPCLRSPAAFLNVIQCLRRALYPIRSLLPADDRCRKGRDAALAPSL
jgi:hypothetical protein